MPFDVRRELAEKWGYGLFFGRLTAANVEKAIGDAGSVHVWGWGNSCFVQDPRAVAAKGAFIAADGPTSEPCYSDWNRYLPARRTHYEGVLAS